MPQGKKEDSLVLGENPYQYLVCLQQPDPKKTSKDVILGSGTHFLRTVSPENAKNPSCSIKVFGSCFIKIVILSID